MGAKESSLGVVSKYKAALKKCVVESVAKN
jgi:hypothetical protein